MGSYCVYIHTSPSGKVYIGITKIKPEYRWGRGSRYKQHPHFYAAIQKYGWDQIKHEIVYDGLTEEQACEKERELISQYNATDRRFGYNAKSGGEIGIVFTEDARRNISAGLKKFYEEHPEEREKIRNRVSGRKHTEEAKRKMSIAKTGTHYPRTEEWNTKISASNKIAYKKGTEVREKATKRCIENGLSKREPVEQCDNEWNVIRRFESMKSAGRETGIRDGNISKCCRGKALTAGGYKWRYATEYSDREAAL